MLYMLIWSVSDGLQLCTTYCWLQFFYTQKFYEKTVGKKKYFVNIRDIEAGVSALGDDDWLPTRLHLSYLNKINVLIWSLSQRNNQLLLAFYELKFQHALHMRLI